MSPQRFWVLHDCGLEGWAIVDKIDHPSILAAVTARERDLANGGGTVVIVEVIYILEAYRRADYQVSDEARKTKAGEASRG